MSPWNVKGQTAVRSDTPSPCSDGSLLGSGHLNDVYTVKPNNKINLVMICITSVWFTLWARTGHHLKWKVPVAEQNHQTGQGLVINMTPRKESNMNWPPILILSLK